jgi:hypothetical protein
MPTRDEVKDYQRRLAALDAAHIKARARLDTLVARRAEAVAEQDQLVAKGEDEVRRAVLDIANAFGPRMAADLVGLDLAEVRRLAKGARQHD